MGTLDDTLILFLSDNGASAEIMVRDDGHDPEAAPGSASSYLCLGPGWSNMCNTPFRRHKTWVFEGGSCYYRESGIIKTVETLFRTIPTRICYLRNPGYKCVLWIRKPHSKRPIC